MMEIYSFSAKGNRENNEDYILSSRLSPECSLFLVADGMGGYLHGEIASSLACETIAEHVTDAIGKTNINRLIINALNLASDRINKKSKSLGTKIGTTIAGALVEKNKGFFFWLGDVRIYHFRNSELLFQSEDHSLINEMKRNRNVAPKEIKRYGTIITKSLPSVLLEEDPVIIETSLFSGDVLIICSDGLWQKANVTIFQNLTKDILHSWIISSEKVFDDNYSLLRIIL